MEIRIASPCATAIPVMPTDWVAACWRIAPPPMNMRANVPMNSARCFCACSFMPPPCVSEGLLESGDGLLVEPLRQLHHQLHGRIVVLPVHDRRMAVDVPGRDVDDQGRHAGIIDVEAAGV